MEQPPDLADTELVSGNYFQSLGVQPAMGRLLLPSDDELNSNPVVVLSFNFWKTKLGSDPRVLNQTLLINAHPFTIIGVALRASIASSRANAGDFRARWSPRTSSRRAGRTWRTELRIG